MNPFGFRILPALSIVLMLGVACSDDAASTEAEGGCPVPTDWDETAFDLTDDSLERAIELRRIAMSTGEVIRSDEFRISVVPVWNESTPTISVSIAEWRELADVLVVVENVEPGTTGTPGQDWCLSVFVSPTSYEDTVDLVEDVSA